MCNCVGVWFWLSLTILTTEYPSHLIPTLVYGEKERVLTFGLQPFSHHAPLFTRIAWESWSCRSWFSFIGGWHPHEDQCDCIHTLVLIFSLENWNSGPVSSEAKELFDILPYSLKQPTWFRPIPLTWITKIKKNQCQSL